MVLDMCCMKWSFSNSCCESVTRWEKNEVVPFWMNQLHPLTLISPLGRRERALVQDLSAGSQKFSIAYETYFWLSEETFPSQMLFIFLAQLKEKEEARFDQNRQQMLEKKNGKGCQLEQRTEQPVVHRHSWKGPWIHSLSVWGWSHFTFSCGRGQVTITTQEGENNS